MNNKLEIVGIDHGWSNIKTANTVFTTAVSHIANEPGVFDNILEYEGKYYSIGGKRLMVKDTKVTDCLLYTSRLVRAYESGYIFSIGKRRTAGRFFNHQRKSK